MFPKSGKHLKSIASIYLAIGLVFVLLSSIAMFVTAADTFYGGGIYVLIGIVILLLGSWSVWLNGYKLYSIGQISENTDHFDNQNTSTNLTTKSTSFCPQCGRTISSDSVFCPECGKQIT